MRHLRFAAETAWRIADYGSSFRLARLLRSREGEVRVDIAYLEPGDYVGRHRAGLPQLFCVVAGTGWAQGDDERERRIARGDAVFWTSGEWHAARTDDGLTAVIVQSDALDPDALPAQS